jgi:glutamate-1-semialdehyde 2,1-aminomutase
MISDEDLALLRRAETLTIGASQTNSRRHGKVGTAEYPAFAVRGRGAILTFQDGRTAIDLAGANGAIALGYQDPVVSGRVSRYSENGGTLSLPTPLEVLASQMMCDALSMDARVRWVRTGSEAVSAAVSIAQEDTGSDCVGVFRGSYHGWHPWTRQAIELTSPEVEDYSSLAAILVESPRWEPVCEDYIEGLRQLREDCTRSGAMLIFDDVVYGFRFATGGLQETTGVTPDLACFSKALGNGFPVGCVVGNPDLMKRTEYRVSSTFGGEMTGLAAATGVLRVHAMQDVCGKLRASGTYLRKRLDRALEGSPIRVEGQPQHFRFVSDSRAILDAFLTGCISHKHPVLIHRDANNINLAIDGSIRERIAATVASVAKSLTA